MNNSKASVVLTIVEALSGVLSVIALVGNLVVGAKEAKQIGCDENVNKSN